MTAGPRAAPADSEAHVRPIQEVSDVRAAASADHEAVSAVSADRAGAAPAVSAEAGTPEALAGAHAAEAARPAAAEPDAGTDFKGPPALSDALTKIRRGTGAAVYS